jgi:hypothetical protein
MRRNRGNLIVDLSIQQRLSFSQRVLSLSLSFPLLGIRVRRVGSALGAVEPLDVSQTPADLGLLGHGAGGLLLFLRLELHVATLGVAAGGSAVGTGSGRALDGADGGRGGHGGAGTRVLEAVHVDGEVALLGKATVVDVPLLGAECADELLVVRDHDDTTAVLANGDGETTKRLAVQEVGRLVEHKQMGVVPHGTSQDDLDLLSTGQARDLVVVGNLRVETNILEVLGDDLGLELTETETLSAGLVVIVLLDHLLETAVGESLTRDHAVVLGQPAEPLDLVLEGLLVLLTTDEGLDLARTLAIVHVNLDLHLLAVLVGENTGLLKHDLAIITVGVTPLEVLVGSLLHVHLNVLKSVLLDVADTQVGVLLDLTLLRNNLTSQDLDEGRLTGTVGADNGDSAA